MAKTKSTEPRRSRSGRVGSISIMAGRQTPTRPAVRQRDHFIPIRQAELVDLLASQPDLKPAEVDLFRRLSQILSATIHHEYQQELDALKADYAPFDPDSDTVACRHRWSAKRSRRDWTVCSIAWENCSSGRISPICRATPWSRPWPAQASGD